MSPPVHNLIDLADCIRRSADFSRIVAALNSGNSGTIEGAWGSSSALAAAAVVQDVPGCHLFVMPRLADVDEFALDLSHFLGLTPEIFPAWETLPQERQVSDVIFGSRLRILRALSQDEPPRAIVTSIAAILQPVPSRADRDEGTRVLRKGESINLDDLLRWFVERGFQRVAALELPGEFSVHGGIIDVFPPDATDPLRCEFFGDELESIRTFDIETQRRIEELDEASLVMVSLPVPVDKLQQSRFSAPIKRERQANELLEKHEHLLDSLPTACCITLLNLPDIVDEAKNYLSRLRDRRGLFSLEATFEKVTRFPTVNLAPLAADSLETTCRLKVESIERFTGPKNEVLSELASVAGRDERVLIACHNAGEKERLGELLAEKALTIGAGVELCEGHVSRGFRFVEEKLIVISDHELFGRTEIRRTARRKFESRPIDDFLDLQTGDLVVHLSHGIAKYHGMEVIDKEGQREEHLILEFQDQVRVYVPVSLIHLVQKYIGSGKVSPELSKLGGTGWNRRKEKVAQAVMDMASDMIRLQADRATKPGIVFPQDSHWQNEFEASFPYTPTTDQVSAVADVKFDMESPRPMDRLICGDVGYGKTEVAIRAAFKAVDAGKQVAVLVPTTVLAEQHYRTFRDRMAEYPISVEVLSRFRTKGEQKKILEDMESGNVDLVIGTHRIVQDDVKFKDLGLLLIDEEQRFGVAAKEKLKQLRLEVDVLTLSATPIPWTLHMSLLGIRDISNLLTPPQDRIAVETRICRFDPELIRQAVVRELNRNGQVYFVHNRVYNIKTIADRLQQIVPEARIGIGHGQMNEHELEDVMLDFVAARIDILVCTTIIESGLDIPNANTIFIHQAENYGLADLHQLRGRVGRYKHRAYCYLLIPEGKSLTPIAAKRLKSIEEFSELGAGFKIAMRDLEIRGAGNILGTEQSGHIAAVGYELYCQLLENAVRRLKNQPLREHRHVAVHLPGKAYFPDEYIPAGRQKIDLYRRVSAVANSDELNDFVNELRDRFGPPPEVVLRLIAMKELQLLAQSWQIDDLHLEGGYLVLGYRSVTRIHELAACSRTPVRIVDTQHAMVLLPKTELSDDGLLTYVKSVLQSSPANPKSASDPSQPKPRKTRTLSRDAAEMTPRPNQR
ncbi:MAG: transcription-repair coupling factor [Planctomycetaceae bacterium]